MRKTIMAAAIGAAAFLTAIPAWAEAQGGESGVELVGSGMDRLSGASLALLDPREDGETAVTQAEEAEADSGNTPATR